MGYTDREVKAAVAEAIEAVENLSKGSEFNSLFAMKSGEMWPKLTKKQRQMVVELMPCGEIGITSVSGTEIPGSSPGGAGQAD